MKPWSRRRRPEVDDQESAAAAGTAPEVPGPPAEAAPAVAEPGAVPVPDQVALAEAETEQLMHDQRSGQLEEAAVNTLGAPLSRRSPFYLGLMAGLGLLVSYGLVHMVLQLGEIITYVLVAVFLALGLEPLVSQLMRRGLRRGSAVLVVMVALLAVVAALGWIIIPTFIDQVVLLVNKTPTYLSDVQHNRLVERLDTRFDIASRLQERARSSLDAGTITSVLGGVLGAGKAVLDSVIAVVTVLVLTLYLMAALPEVKAAGYKLVPQHRRVRVVFLGEEMSRRVGGYVLGQVTVATINGILTWTMLVILSLPFPAVLAVLAALLALVPIVGTIVGGVIIVLVALTGGWLTAVIALAYYIAYHAFEAYVLSPRIMHRAVDVPAVVTILAVLAGGTLLGIVGALVAIPVAAGLSLIYEQVLVPRQQALVSPPT